MNKNKIMLTFGIPIYNAEKYLDNLLKCFDFSTDFPYEVVAVDDGSSDDSLKICQKYKKNIRIISQKNHGVSFTRNVIINFARGEWITFIDSDDIINFQQYIKEFKKFIESDYEFIINVSNSNKYKKLMSKNDKLSFLITDEIINSPVANFYRKDLLNKYNIKFNEHFSLGEDLLFNLLYYSKCKNIKFISNEMMYFVNMDNQQSLSRKYRDNKFYELMCVNEECFSIFPKGMYNNSIYKSLEYIRIKACISCIKDIILLKGESHDCYLEILKMKKYKKKQYLFLNDFRTSMIYNAWYYIPTRIIFAIMKHIF